jgi:hypothetical protein
MLHLAPRFGFSLASLFQCVPDLSGLGGCEHVVGIYQAPWPDEYAAGVPAERHEIAFLKVHAFEEFARDDHLAPLADAADPVLSLSCHSDWHVFRLSDY